MSTTWDCSECGNVNYKGYTHCAKCNSPMTDDTEQKTKEYKHDYNSTLKTHLEICRVCKSDDINKHFINGQLCSITCNNCALPTEIVQIKYKDYNKGLYRVLNREEINPVLMKICSICKFEIFVKDEKKTYECANCKIINPKITTIKKTEYNRDNFTILHREFVNPELISVCSLCYCKNIIEKYFQLELKSICSNCQITNPQKINIKKSEYDQGIYKIIARHIANPEMIYICSVCKQSSIAYDYINFKHVPRCKKCNIVNINLLYVKKSEID